MNVIHLSAFDLSLAAVLVLAPAILSKVARLGLARSILIAALRTTAQLFLIGFVLRALFAHVQLGRMAPIASFMLLVAGYEVEAPLKRADVQRRSVRHWTMTSILASFIFLPDYGRNATAPWVTAFQFFNTLSMSLINTLASHGLRRK